jgi:hypothetical protein
MRAANNGKRRQKAPFHSISAHHGKTAQDYRNETMIPRGVTTTQRPSCRLMASI